MHVKVFPILLACMTVLRWYGECILLEQLDPPNGTSACPGDRIKLVCNTTFQNETTLTWQAICGECEPKSFFGNNPNAFSGTLKLPNGANATWEAETLHHTSPGVNTTITSSLIINASLDLHNVTIACCSEHSPSLCKDSAAIPNEYKGIAVINISANSKCDDHHTPRNTTLQMAHFLVQSITSCISLFVSTIACIIQATELRAIQFVLIADATTFAFINVFIQIPIYHLNKAEPASCTAAGAILQVFLICTTLLTLYLCTKFRNFTLECSSLRLECIFVILVLVAVVAIAVVIAPGVSGSYGDAGGWCWIKNNDGISLQIITSILNLTVPLLGFVFAMMECCKHREAVRCWKHREDEDEDDTNYYDFLATATCFLASFLASNLISLVVVLASGRPLYYLMFVHSVIYPLWPFITTLPTILRILICAQKCGKKLPKRP